jgi:hypothetical protein
MNKLFVTSLVAGGLGLNTAAHAQLKVSLGPVVGETLMKQHVDTNSGLDHRFGLVAGAQAYLSRGRFALQPALLFAQKGYKYATEIEYRSGPNSPVTQATYAVKQRLNYLTLPVNFVFAPSGSATGPQFFAGPYVSLLLGGNIEQGELPDLSASTTSLRIANEARLGDGPTARRFDAGFQAGLGFRVDGLVLQASYSLGLGNIRPTYVDVGGSSASAYNRGFQVSVAYLFDIIQ